MTITQTSSDTLVNDPLSTRVVLEHDALFYPYGYPVRIRSNSRTTLEAAYISWSTYTHRHEDTPLDIRLVLSTSDSPACVEPPTFRSQGHLLSIVADRENFASLDLNAGFAFGWATEATARNQEYFRQCLLDVMIYPLLEVRHLVTLHAACVIYRSKGILLAGNSGAGKSSLSYACARRGWTFVSDDASAFRRCCPVPTVIGHPQKFRFREPVGQLFPEFRDLKSTLRAYGKPTIEVLTRTIDSIQGTDESHVDAIVFLNRPAYQSGPPLLLPVSYEDAWKRLCFSVWAVQMPAFEERLAALERLLLTVPTFEIQYSELGPAVDLLERAVQDKLF
ncbi:MAG: aldolase [Acidobacteriaceae bacterium]|nr:aldolase [Acidobacteriaceae bacterium]